MDGRKGAEDMNLYRISYDTCEIIILAHDYDQLLEMLQAMDKNFISKGRYKLTYKWDNDTIDDCIIETCNIQQAGVVAHTCH